MHDMDWVKFWSFFFFLSLTIFAALAVVVTIGGFFNIRSLFKSLKEQAAASEDGESAQG
jgi:hypothetical protein